MAVVTNQDFSGYALGALDNNAAFVRSVPGFTPFLQVVDDGGINKVNSSGATADAAAQVASGTYNPAQYAEIIIEAPFTNMDFGVSVWNQPTSFGTFNCVSCAMNAAGTVTVAYREGSSYVVQGTATFGAPTTGDRLGMGINTAGDTATIYKNGASVGTVSVSGNNFSGGVPGIFGYDFNSAKILSFTGGNGVPETGANQPPTLTTDLTVINAIINEAFTLDVTGNFQDLDGTIDSFDFTALPAGITETSDGVISGTPTSTSSTSITVTATDDDNATAVDTFTLDITAPVPVGSLSSNTIVRDGAAVTITGADFPTGGSLAVDTSRGANKVALIVGDGTNEYFLPLTVVSGLNSSAAPQFSCQIVEATAVLHDVFDACVLHVDGTDIDIANITVSPASGVDVFDITETPLTGAGTVYGDFATRNIGDEGAITQQPDDGTTIISVAANSGIQYNQLPATNQTFTRQVRDITGAIIEENTDTLEAATAQDSTPDAFDFSDNLNAQENTSIQSNPVTVSGFDVLLEVSIRGDASAEFSINGDTFSATERAISVGQTLQLSVDSGDFEESKDISVDLSFNGSTVAVIDWIVTSRAEILAGAGITVILEPLI